MSESPSSLFEAVSDGDSKRLRALIVGAEFMLLSTSKSEEDEEGNVGAITAEIEDMEVLVVFTSEQTAGQFVHENRELFEEDEEVDGIVVDGQALLDYLPDGLGILLDPESDDAIVIDPGLLEEVKTLEG